MESGNDLQMKRTDELHVFAKGGDPDSPDVEQLEAPLGGRRQPVVERENVRLAENALLYNSVATGMSRRLP